VDGMTDVLHNTPNVIGQAQGHGRSLALQGTMNADPVVEISPYVDTLLQQICAARTILCSTGKASLLTTKRTVEPFQMRGIDPSADCASRKFRPC